MNGMDKIRVILVDDHEVVRRGIRDFLIESGRIDVVAEGANGNDALHLVTEFQPDVAILDVQMPGPSGIDVARSIKQTKMPVGVLILTAFDDDPYVVAAVEAGVNGYVLKTADAEEIVEAVFSVHEGKSVIDPGIVHKLMNAVATSTEAPIQHDSLTQRELDVLREAAQGLTNKAIGLKLGISDRSVQGHLRNIFEKLQVTNRTEAVVKAAQLGLLEILP
ncbi:MAG: response regulator transcription factor [Chloroflexi bacterium]|nr:response regulator transcription factor [Chloroflexota bacterium]